MVWDSIPCKSVVTFISKLLYPSVSISFKNWISDVVVICMGTLPLTLDLLLVIFQCYSWNSVIFLLVLLERELVMSIVILVFTSSYSHSQLNLVYTQHTHTCANIVLMMTWQLKADSCMKNIQSLMNSIRCNERQTVRWLQCNHCIGLNRHWPNV